MSLTEKNDRADAKVWLIKNNHNIMSGIKEDGLALVVEGAYVEGCKKYHKTVVELKREISELMLEVFDLTKNISSLKSKLFNVVNADDLSVENL